MHVCSVYMPMHVCSATNSLTPNLRPRLMMMIFRALTLLACVFVYFPINRTQHGLISSFIQVCLVVNVASK